MPEQESNASLKSIIGQLKQISNLKRQVQKALLEKSIQQVTDDIQASNTIKGNFADEIGNASSILSNDLREDIGKSTESARKLPSALADTIKAKMALKKLNHEMEKGKLSEVEQELVDEKSLYQDKVRTAMQNNDFATAQRYVAKAQELDNQLLAEQMSRGRIGATERREQASIVDANMASVKAYKEGMKTNVKGIFAEYTERKTKAKETKNQSLAKIENKGFMAKIKNLFSQMRLGIMNTKDGISSQVSAKLEAKSANFRNSINEILESTAQSKSEQMNQLMQMIDELQPSEEKTVQTEKESARNDINSDQELGS